MSKFLATKVKILPNIIVREPSLSILNKFYDYYIGRFIKHFGYNIR